jgi:hydrogenase maturation protease
VPRVQVVGVGSPFGDDRIGWLAVERLGARAELGALPAADLVMCARDRPGTLLLDEWGDAESVLLIDAVCSGAATGTLHCIPGAQLRSFGATRSSHGFGVGEALALAGALGHDLTRIAVYGIEIDPDQQGDSLSGPVQAALGSLVDRVAQDVLRQLRNPVGAGPLSR